MKPPKHIDAARNSTSLLAQAGDWVSSSDVADRDVHVEWTTATINRAARIAASRHRFGQVALRDDPSDIAVSAVGMAVAENPGIGFWDAVNCGSYAIVDARNGLLRDRGLHGDGQRLRPRFWLFWLDDTPRFHSPEGADERAALNQVLTALPERHRAVLMQIAFAQSLEEAAEMAGVTNLHTYRSRVRTARKAALELWFDGETPPRPRKEQLKHTVRTCKNGHAVTGENAIRHALGGGRYGLSCRECQRQRRAEKRMNGGAA